MIQSPEVQSKIAVWRRKALDGTITLDEMKQAILIMREARNSAAQQTRAKPASNRRSTKSADDLLSEFENL
ncbi:MAG: hypothetical protein ACREBW_01920 [Candidatus Micrarchaeaceae archaeon]